MKYTDFEACESSTLRVFDTPLKEIFLSGSAKDLMYSSAHSMMMIST